MRNNKNNNSKTFFFGFVTQRHRSRTPQRTDELFQILAQKLGCMPVFSPLCDILCVYFFVSITFHIFFYFSLKKNGIVIETP